MSTNILAAIRQRTLVLRFLSRTPPQSTVDSLKSHFRISECISGCGSIIHYAQDCCPVTKHRLPGLTVLVEDLKRDIKNRDAEQFGEEVLDLPSAQLSELEQRVVSEFKNDDELRLVSAARGVKNDIM